MQTADALLDIYQQRRCERLTGEPDALKGASPVRRGAVGKGLHEQHLAGRLPYWRKCGSCGGGADRSAQGYTEAVHAVASPVRLAPVHTASPDVSMAAISRHSRSC